MIEKVKKGIMDKEGKIVFLSAFFMGILTYGYEMSNFALTIDEEANWNQDVLEYFLRRVSDGRFMCGFTKLFLPTVLLPFWSTALFVTGLAVAAFLLNTLFQEYIESIAAKILMAGVFVTLPIHAYYVMFSNMSAETAMGYCLTIVALLLLEQNNARENIKNIKTYILAIGCMVIANGVYQAFFEVYVTLVCCYLMLKTLNAIKQKREVHLKQEMLWIGKHILFLILSAIIYTVFVKALQTIFRDSRNYVESFFIWNIEEIKNIVRGLIEYVYMRAFSTVKSVGFSTYIFYTILWIVIMLAGIVMCKKSTRLIMVVAGVGMYASVFLMPLISGSRLPERTFLSAPVMAGVVLAIAVDNVRLKKCRNVLIGIGTLIVLNQSAKVTDLFWAETRSQMHDEIRIAELTQSIEALGYGEIPDKPVILLNNVDYTCYDGTFGYSYFNLGNRIYGKLSYYGYDYIRGNSEQIKWAQTLQKDMPYFPEEGSIMDKKDCVVINLR